MTSESQATPFPYDVDTLASIDRWLAYRVWHSQVPGAQVAIGVAGEVGFSRAYGLADLEAATPMRLAAAGLIGSGIVLMKVSS